MAGPREVPRVAAVRFMSARAEQEPERALIFPAPWLGPSPMKSVALSHPQRTKNSRACLLCCTKIQSRLHR